jgi:succinyl-diaminopimelate desuccinylase
MKEFLRRLIQAETTALKGELAAAQTIAAELERSGIESRIETWDQTRANIVARVRSTRRKKALLFVCHLDVVGPGEAPWTHPPFAAVESDGKIYGRGAADMKGCIAAVVTAIRRVAESGAQLQGDVMLLGAAGEETDSCGARRFVGNPSAIPELSGIVVTEPTEFDVVNAHRGLLWLEVATEGKAAHGSTPHLGVNAITSMKSVLDELERYRIPFEPHRLLGRCSMSINKIAGGQAINVVPDKCSIAVDIRTLPSQNHNDIVAGFEKILAKLRQGSSQFAAEVSIIRDVQALETDGSCDFVRDFCSAVGRSRTKAVGFTTDGPYFASLGVPVVVFGPGKSELCHKPDEYIDLADVEKGVELYKNIILRFLA